MAVVMILHRLVSGKVLFTKWIKEYWNISKMDIVYEDKDKIILNKPVAGDGKYGGNMAV